MYYKIKSDILFRKYAEYGYLTDNSKFEYRLLNDTTNPPGEKYISEIGAVMLSQLTKTPRHIDEIIEELLQIFSGVERKTLLEDVEEFFQGLVKSGFLSGGETDLMCQDQEKNTERIQQWSENSINAENNEPQLELNQNDLFRYLHIELTTACNERCLHCYVPDNGSHKFMDSSLFCRILEEGREMNLIHVTLSGGEPFLHEDFLDFLVKCREFDLSVNVLSNLTLLTEEIILEMKKNPMLSVQTSIYSMDPSVHDEITQQKGSFEKTNHGLMQLYNSGIMVQISCPILRRNKDTFLDVVHYGHSKHIGVSVEPVIFGIADHSSSNLNNRLSLAELELATEMQLTNEYVRLMKESAMQKEQLTGDDLVCPICRHSFCIAPNATVFPCVGWNSKVIGDLKHQSLREIWETSEEISKLRQIKRNQFPHCVACENRAYCQICMMCNANENKEGDPFCIDNFRCYVAEVTRKKVTNFN